MTIKRKNAQGMELWIKPTAVHLKIILKVKDYGLKANLKEISGKAKAFLTLLAVLANLIGNSLRQFYLNDERSNTLSTYQKLKLNKSPNVRIAMKQDFWE